MTVPHIVLIGDISHSALVDFLNEYFNKDHGDHKRHCVILQNCIPSIDIQTSIQDPQYKQQVQYLEGSPQNMNDLKRADILRCEAVVILNDKLSSDAGQSDIQVILQAMYIKNYL